MRRLLKNWMKTFKINFSHTKMNQKCIPKQKGFLVELFKRKKHVQNASYYNETIKNR